MSYKKSVRETPAMEFKKKNQQPKAAHESETGYGDKKLDGPNQPST